MIKINTYKDDAWGNEQRYENSLFNLGDNFRFKITTRETHFNVKFLSFLK